MTDTKDFTRTAYLELEAKHAKLEQAVKDALNEINNKMDIIINGEGSAYSNGMGLAYQLAKDIVKQKTGL